MIKKIQKFSLYSILFITIFGLFASKPVNKASAAECTYAFHTPQLHPNSVPSKELKVQLQFTLTACSQVNILNKVKTWNYGFVVTDDIGDKNRYQYVRSDATFREVETDNINEFNDPATYFGFGGEKYKDRLASNIQDYRLIINLKVKDPFTRWPLYNDVNGFSLFPYVGTATSDDPSPQNRITIQKPLDPNKPDACRLDVVLVTSTGQEVALRNSKLNVNDYDKYRLRTTIKPGCPVKQEVHYTYKKGGDDQGNFSDPDFVEAKNDTKYETFYTFGNPNGAANYLYTVGASNEPWNTAKGNNYRNIDYPINFTTEDVGQPEIKDPEYDLERDTGFTDVPDYDASEKSFDNLIKPGSIPELIGQIIRIMLALIASIAVIVIIVSGFRMVLYGNNPTALASAKKAIIWSIIGLVVALMSFSIVAVIQRIIQQQP